MEPEDDASEVMTLKDFVDKFSLPRVVKFEGEDRPVLLYRVLEAHRRVEAVPLSGKKGKLVGKPLYIPDSYDGECFFSLSIFFLFDVLAFTGLFLRYLN